MSSVRVSREMQSTWNNERPKTNTNVICMRGLDFFSTIKLSSKLSLSEESFRSHFFFVFLKVRLSRLCIIQEENKVWLPLTWCQVWEVQLFDKWLLTPFWIVQVLQLTILADTVKIYVCSLIIIHTTCCNMQIWIVRTKEQIVHSHYYLSMHIEFMLYHISRSSEVPLLEPIVLGWEVALAADGV